MLRRTLGADAARQTWSILALNFTNYMIL